MLRKPAGVGYAMEWRRCRPVTPPWMTDFAEYQHSSDSRCYPSPTLRVSTPQVFVGIMPDAPFWPITAVSRRSEAASVPKWLGVLSLGIVARKFCFGCAAGNKRLQWLSSRLRFVVCRPFMVVIFARAALSRGLGGVFFASLFIGAHLHTQNKVAL